MPPKIEVTVEDLGTTYTLWLLPWTPENGKALAARREALGLTQAQLARKVGCDAMTISRWERGCHSPRARQRKRLAKALGLTPEALR